MLDRDTIIATLRAHEAELRAKGVEGLYLFGSVARGEAGPSSDVDLFIDDAPHMGMKFFEVRDIIAGLFPFKVDLTARGALHRLLKAEIESQAQQVF